jgi:ribonuclease HI
VLINMGVKEVMIFGDSRMVVQQVNGESQCLYGVFNGYREKCVDMLKMMDKFSLDYVPQEENATTNMLAQQASGCDIQQGKSQHRVMSWLMTRTTVTHGLMARQQQRIGGRS